MKTNSTKKEQRNANIQSGASSAVGAVVGVTAATSVESAFAAEESEILVEPLDNPTRPVATNVVEEPAPPVKEEIITPQEPERPEASQNPEIVEVTVNGTSYVFADVDNDGIADVVAVDLNNNGRLDEGEAADISQDGVLMADVRDLSQQGSVVTTQPNEPTLASVEVDGTTYHFADVNNDGIADLGAIDVNGNGIIEDTEIADVHDQGIMMADLEAMQSNSGNNLAYNDGSGLPDYTNDADVNEYMA